MKERFVMVALALLCILATLASTGRAAEVFHYHENGMVADAIFDSFDESGCVETTVLSSSEYAPKVQSAPGPGTQWTGTILAISKFDYCDQTLLMDAIGADDYPPDFNFQVDPTLGSASLTVPITVYDSVSAQYLNMKVQLTWTSSGPMTLESDISNWTSPGITISNRLNGTYRWAQAVGSVSEGSTNFTPDVSAWGRVFRVKIGSLYVENRQ